MCLRAGLLVLMVCCRSTMLGLEPDFIYLTDHESSKRRVPYKRSPLMKENVPGIGQYFFNFTPVPSDWDQAKADALRQDPGLVPEIRHTLSILQSQHRHFLLESRREQERASADDWRKMSLALTSSILEAEHQRTRMTEIERENEELKLKISQLSEQQGRAVAIASPRNRISNKDQFLISRKRLDTGIHDYNDNEGSATLRGDPASPCRGRAREVAGAKRICHTDIRRTRNKSPVPAPYTSVQEILRKGINGVSESFESSDDDGSDAEAFRNLSRGKAIIPQQHESSNNDGADEEDEHVIRVLESPPPRKTSQEVIHIIDDEPEHASEDELNGGIDDDNNNLTAENADDQAGHSHLPPSAEKENHPPPLPAIPNSAPPRNFNQEPPFYAPVGALFLTSPSKRVRPPVVPPSTTHVSPTTAATEFRNLGSDTPRTDFGLPPLQESPTVKNSAQTAEQSVSATVKAVAGSSTVKRGRGRPRKDANTTRGGGVKKRGRRPRNSITASEAQEKEKEKSVAHSEKVTGVRKRGRPRRSVASSVIQQEGRNNEDRGDIQEKTDKGKASEANVNPPLQHKESRLSVANDETQDNTPKNVPRQAVALEAEMRSYELETEEAQQEATEVTDRILTGHDTASDMQRQTEQRPIPVTKTPKTHPLVEIQVNKSNASKRVEDYPLINNYDVDSPQKEATSASMVENTAIESSGAKKEAVPDVEASESQPPPVLDVVGNEHENQTEEVLLEGEGNRNKTAMADRIIARLEKSWEEAF